MADAREGLTIDRRGLLIGGGAGVGLILAWAIWPRRYAPNLTAARGETIYDAWLKIGEDGHVSVAVPQAEHGQGVYTVLPQILADELGADWRAVAVEPAPLNPLYANPLAADEIFAGVFDRLPDSFQQSHARRAALVLTAGSTSVRMFADTLADAGAAARVMLCKAAARRRGVDWQACTASAGFVVHGKDRLRFGELLRELGLQDAPGYDQALTGLPRHLELGMRVMKKEVRFGLQLRETELLAAFDDAKPQSKAAQ